MSKLLTRNLRINALVGVAILAVCSFQGPVQAQERKPSHISIMNFGLVRGEVARITVVNENSPEISGPGEPISGHVKVFDSAGNQIYQSPEVDIPAGSFRSIEVDREQLSLPGDLVTGRVQVLGKMILFVREHLRRADLASTTPFVGGRHVSLEIINKSTGQTTVLLPPGPRGMRDAESRIRRGAWILDTTRAPIGFVPGESLIFTAYNPIEGRPEGLTDRDQSISLQLKLQDEQGRFLVEGPELEIPPGQFRSVVFKWSDLGITGEPATHRAQLRTTPLWGVRARPRLPVHASLEIVNDTTGKTMLNTDQCLVFFLGGIP